MRHFKSLDGFRGLAVLVVIAFHYAYLPVGWMGVQMFFVLSGFLITGILLRHKSVDIKPYLGRFYWRRTLRIWPLYFAFLGFLALTFWKTGKPLGFEHQWPYLATFTANFPQNLDSTLGHLWSLSVEEQFYLVWPFVVYLTSPAVFRRLLLVLILGGPPIRYVVGLILAPLAPDALHLAHAVYTFPLSQFDAFAVGALLSVLPQEMSDKLKPRSGAILWALLGLTALAGGGMLVATRARGWEAMLSFGYPINLPQFHQYVWGYSLLNACSSALIFHLVHRSTPSGFFENPAMVYIGRISFGVYVWHLAVLHFFWRLLPGWPGDILSLRGAVRFVLYLGALLAVASLSFWTFERFFLRLKDAFSPRREASHQAKAA